MIYELKDTSKAEHLFKGMDDSMIISCLQGIMGGKIYVTDPVSPKSAMAFLAEFAWLAGEPDRELVASKPKGLVGLVPQDGRWEALIRECWPDVEKTDRYAIKKGTKFDREKLKAIAAALPAGYEIRRVDGDIYDMCLECDDFEDAVSHFESKEQYLQMGRGFAVLKEGKPVSVASSYSVYREGIEIEIDTVEEERRKGLAGAACATLILSCLDDGLYPSWDAANMDSVHLAEKLGYEFDRQYSCYWLSDVFDRVIADPDKSEWDSFCGRYQRLNDERRIYEIDKKNGDLYYHFTNPEAGIHFDLRMYPVGDRRFGINEDDFEIVFSEGAMTVDGFPCKKL